MIEEYERLFGKSEINKDEVWAAREVYQDERNRKAYINVHSEQPPSRCTITQPPYAALDQAFRMKRCTITQMKT